MINVRVHTILNLVERLGAQEITMALPDGSTVVELLGVVDTALKDGDDIALLPPIAGG